MTNVLMISLDDVAKFDLDNVLTPNLTALREESTDFIYSFAASSVCSPSRIAAYTGQYPRRFDIGVVVTDGATVDVPTATVTIGDMMKANGFATAHIGKWHMSGNVNYPVLTAPGAMGYDTWRAMTRGNIDEDLPGTGLGRGLNGTYDKWGRIDGTLAGGGFLTTSHTYAPATQAAEAVTWWQATGGPKYLTLSFNSAHDPYHTPAAQYLPAGFVVQPGKRGKFEAALMAVDKIIGDMFAAMTLTDTIIIFWTDNGTPQDALGVGQNASKVKQSMFQDGVCCPIWVKHPTLEPRTTHRIVSNVDFMATLKDMLSLTQALPADSLSFADVFGFTRSTAKRVFAYSERFSPSGDPDVFDDSQRMVVAAHVTDETSIDKLINYRFDSTALVTVTQLHNLTTDPLEVTPLVNAGVEATLQAMMDSI